MLIVLYLVIVVAVLFVAAAVATREDDLLVDVPADAADVELPAGPLQAEDVAEVRFGLVVRGYRMSEVDTVLARLAAELAARDTRILALEQALADVVEPAVAALEKSVPPVPEVVPPATSVVADDPSQVHAPVVTAPEPEPVVEAVVDPSPEAHVDPAPLVAVDDAAFDPFDFPQVGAPDRAPEGLPESTEPEPEPAAEVALEPAPEPVAPPTELAAVPQPWWQAETLPVPEEAAAAAVSEASEVSEPPLGHPGEGAVPEHPEPRAD